MTIPLKIQEVTATLKWRLLLTKGNADMEITSNPWERTHTIRLPSEGSAYREIEYLHELAHAVLAERHHLLSTAWFVRGIPEEQYKPLTNPIQVASDWFADHLMMLWCPREERAEIQEHAAYAIAYQGHENDMIFGGGLSLAQLVKYCGAKAHTIPKRYREVTDALLDTDPYHLSVGAKMKLINALAKVAGCPYRVFLTNEEGMDVWGIRAEGEKRKYGKGSVGVNVMMPVELKERLDAYAEAKGEARNAVIKEAIERMIRK